MKVLWLSHLIPYPPKGGVLQRSFNLISETARYHDVHLLAFNQKALLPTEDAVDNAVSVLKKICKTVQIIPIRCEEKRYGRSFLYAKSLLVRAPFTINWLEGSAVRSLIKYTIEKNLIDLVHFDTISLAPFLDAAMGCKKVLNHHNVESFMMLRRARKETNYLKKLYMYQEAYKILLYEKKLCNQFDVNITCSSLDSERLLEDIEELKVEEVPNGVDLDYFYPLYNERDKLSLIFAGGMNWYPNRNAMLFFADKIWPLLKREVPGVKMTVIGIDPPKPLLDLSKRDSDFVVTGFVDDVRPYIDRASIYVCPIQDGGGTRLKILDALAMGKAVVADPIACEGIEVVDGDSVLFAERPEEYVENIRMLIDNDDMVQRLGEKGRNLIEEKYSYKEIGKKLSMLYESL